MTVEREITTHEVEGDLPQNQLRVCVMDKPGAGGAPHAYAISDFNLRANASYGVFDYPPISVRTLTVLFQNGPIQEKGLNGVTHEALLAILIDRLEGFQSGEYPSEDNATALAYLQLALEALQTRTRKRLARGVEGTLTK